MKMEQENSQSILNYEDLGPNSIEELFCEKYKLLPTREYEKIETSLILYLAKNEVKFNNDEDPIKYMDLILHKALICPKDELRPQYEKDLSDLLESIKFQYDVVTARSKVYDFFINRTVRMIIAITARSLGEITEILTMIQYFCKKTNDRGVRYETYIKMFPFGWAVEEDLTKLWYACKVKKGNNIVNLLDCIEFLESLRIKN